MGTAGSYQLRVREVDRVRAAGKLPCRGTVGRCDGCRSFQFRGFLRHWRFALAAGDVATSSVLERHSPKRWRNSFDCSAFRLSWAIAMKSYAAKAGFPAKPCSSTPNGCTRPAGPSEISPLRLARIAEPSPNGSRWTICPTGNVPLSSQARHSTSRSFSSADGQRAIGAVAGSFMTSGIADIWAASPTLSGCCRLGARTRRVKRHRRQRRQRLSRSGKPRPSIRRQTGRSRPWLPPLSA